MFFPILPDQQLAASGFLVVAARKLRAMINAI